MRGRENRMKVPGVELRWCRELLCGDCLLLLQLTPCAHRTCPTASRAPQFGRSAFPARTSTRSRVGAFASLQRDGGGWASLLLLLCRHVAVAPAKGLLATPAPPRQTVARDSAYMHTRGQDGEGGGNSKPSPTGMQIKSRLSTLAINTPPNAGFPHADFTRCVARSEAVTSLPRAGCQSVLCHSPALRVDEAAIGSVICRPRAPPGRFANRQGP
jgi:hypothetical protein